MKFFGSKLHRKIGFWASVGIVGVNLALWVLALVLHFPGETSDYFVFNAILGVVSALSFAYVEEMTGKKG